MVSTDSFGEENCFFFSASAARLDYISVSHICLIGEYTGFSFGSLKEYSVQITFREDWVDPRLKYDDLNGKFDLKQMLPVGGF